MISNLKPSNLEPVYFLLKLIDLNLAFLGLILSIVYSASEIALLSSNALQIDVWEKQEKRMARWASYILDQKPEYLSVILIGTNLSNILATSFATIYLLRSEWMPNSIIVIPITVIILFFGEILPKSIMREYANFGLLILSPFLIFSYTIFHPIIFTLRKTGWMTISERDNNELEEIEGKRDDLQYAYEQVDDPEAIEKEQQEMISNVFEFSENTVEDAMTPRTEISAVSINDPLKKVLHTFIESGHSKLPVYTNDIDNITGVVYLYDLFHKPENLTQVVKPVLHIPFSKPVRDIMGEFKTANHALAIVLDEHGGTAGLITAEDIFEELFGDFEDEFDEETVKSDILEDGSILVNARIACDDFNSQFGSIIPGGEYETLGGYIITELGRIPNQGEHLFLPIGQVLIIKGSARQIHQVKIFPATLNGGNKESDE